jgi:transcription-repair coupling factor (superfamily II helicase)
LYKRIASAKNKNKLDDIQVELIDRFGLLPQPAKNLVNIAKLRLKAQTIGIARIEAGPLGGSIEFSGNTQIDPRIIITMIQQQPSVFNMKGANKLTFKRTSEDTKARFMLITTILNDLNKTLN